MAKILFIGDVVGKPGRKILREVLPQWKEKYQPDAVIVNVENLAHGKGVTPSTLADIDSLGIDCFTSGNHIFNKHQLSTECFEKYTKLIRPDNFGTQYPGFGYYRFSAAGRQFLAINLNGQVFMDHQFEGSISNPFFAVDKILEQQAQKGDIILVDFHAEATSEKVAMGYYLDGRVSFLTGTHTHVPTADARILAKGTGYITDTGMTGALNAVLGTKKENALKKFLEQGKFVNELEEEGQLQINGVLVEIDDNQKAIKIEKLYQEI
ncbi:MAG: TIGR00282 family metallophosphoesterase [Candidatus Doudnabacteria bacterium]|nr:TIGR00282 family metallophosphoesterase [Candidatus Doudnabacteria bacterium]